MQVLLSKVKSGIFAMPQWLPIDVKDLIQRLLTSDPTKRISLQQTFLHPALTHSSLDYTGPTSTPLEQKVPQPVIFLSTLEPHRPLVVGMRQIARPLGDQPLDEEILQSLYVLGWDDRQALQSALLSTEPTVEKAFYRLLRKRKNRRANGGRLSRENHVQKVSFPHPHKRLACLADRLLW